MLSFNRFMRLMLVVLLTGALLSAAACSSSSKKKVPENKQRPVPSATPTPQAQPSPPATNDTLAPDEHPPLSGIVPFPPEAGIRTIYFDFDKSGIRNDQLSGLDHNLQYLLANPEVKVYVEGHCDERGTVEYNFNLGMRRSESIRNFLVKNGVNASRIVSASKGEEQPADPGHNEAAWAKNRRCEFFQILD